MDCKSEPVRLNRSESGPLGGGADGAERRSVEERRRSQTLPRCFTGTSEWEPVCVT